MKLDIRPTVGVGPIRFRMSREEVRAAIGVPARSFSKTPESPALSDAFDDEGVHVHYRNDGRCEAVEIAAPCRPLYRGRELIGKPYAPVRDWLRTLDESLEEDDTGLTSHALCLGLYASNPREFPEDPVEAVIVFEEGYYG
jgi:hypothetical protein